MPELSPGDTLSHYRIISKLGAGGMGEVYRAQDIELGRPAALKFLSGEVASHQHRFKRFILEAKAASALNHPNILTVYEIGRQDEFTFIATEFVEGVTLRHRMLIGLKLTEILDIAIQIASALVAAHTAGIVHRDIKPDNIMVRKDGIVKVLDFGLAKLTERYDSSLSGSEASTIALVNTEPGAVLGTVAYMSPEQAAGREVDARSDIWSLGVVLYEMLTAHTPFEGASKSHIIVAIMDQEPRPVTEFTPDIPQPLEWIISEALTKDPEERCQTAKELLGKLKRLKQRIDSGVMSGSLSDYDRLSIQPSHSSATESLRLGPSDRRSTQTEAAVGRSTAPSGDHARTVTMAPPDPSTTQKPNRNVYLIAVVVSLVIVSAIALTVYTLFPRTKQFGPAQMSALTTSGKILGEDISGQVSISPDGKYVVCGAIDAKQQPSLWIRQVSTGSLVRLVPPENGALLSTTFSPDGEFVYYVATLEKNKFVPTLYRIPVLGGTPAKVLEWVFSPVAFSKDGRQFAFVRRNQQEATLMLANADGSGEPRTLAVQKPPSSFSLSGPSWSPDGKRIANGVSDGTAATVVEVPVEGGDPRPIGSEKWASVGRIIWVADGSGMIMAAQPKSSSAGTQIWFLPYSGEPARRITNDLNGYGDVSLGVTQDSGTIATIQQASTGGIWIVGPGEDESRARQVVKTNLPETVAWTPDGKIVYASRTGENWDIWISNPDGTDSRQLTSDPFIDQQPSVSGDGHYIVFQSNRSGNRNIWRMGIDGSDPKQLTQSGAEDSAPACSPDGKFVVFVSSRSGKPSIWKIGIDGGATVQLTDGVAEFPTISPDGRLIAYYYADEHSNQPKLMIIPFEGGAPVKTVDLPASVQPLAFAWMPDGKSIAYLDNSSGILNVWSQSIDDRTHKQLTNFKSEFVNTFAIGRDGRIALYRFSATRDIVLIKNFK